MPGQSWFRSDPSWVSACGCKKLDLQSCNDQKTNDPNSRKSTSAQKGSSTIRPTRATTWQWSTTCPATTARTTVNATCARHAAPATNCTTGSSHSPHYYPLYRGATTKKKVPKEKKIHRLSRKKYPTHAWEHSNIHGRQKHRCEAIFPTQTSRGPRFPSSPKFPARNHRDVCALQFLHECESKWKRKLKIIGILAKRVDGVENRNNVSKVSQKYKV